MPNPQNEEAPQQFGPSELEIKELHELIRQLQGELRELRGEKQDRETSTKQSTPTSSGVHKHGMGARLSGEILNEEFSGKDLKILDIVMKLSPPNDKIWAGDDDKRSMRRFIVSVANSANKAGLDRKATYMYLIHRCLDGRVAEIVGRAGKTSELLWI